MLITAGHEVFILESSSNWNIFWHVSVFVLFSFHCSWNCIILLSRLIEFDGRKPNSIICEFYSFCLYYMIRKRKYSEHKPPGYLQLCMVWVSLHAGCIIHISHRHLRPPSLFVLHIRGYILLPILVLIKLIMRRGSHYYIEINDSLVIILLQGNKFHL